MRKVIAAAFVSLDGVMQGPGGPEEDTSGGFAYGGWTVPFWDDEGGEIVSEYFAKPYDLLLGRKTYDIFAGYWPFVEVDPDRSSFDAGNASIKESFDRVTKYVASRSRPELSWQNSEWLGADPVERVRQLKASDGPILLTQGSGDFLQSLFAADLVDELRLLTYPLTLGSGKKFFGTGTQPLGFKLTDSKVVSSGVVYTAYERDGAVKTGSFD